MAYAHSTQNIPSSPSDSISSSKWSRLRISSIFFFDSSSGCICLSSSITFSRMKDSVHWRLCPYETRITKIIWSDIKKRRPCSAKLVPITANTNIPSHLWALKRRHTNLTASMNKKHVSVSHSLGFEQYIRTQHKQLHKLEACFAWTNKYFLSKTDWKSQTDILIQSGPQLDLRWAFTTWCHLRC